MKILLSPWMKELDSVAINDIGIPSIVLMENASRGAAVFFAREFPRERYKNIVAVIGKGNNGGDGIAVGRILSQMGYNVRFLFFAAPETFPPDSKTNFDIIAKLGLDYQLLGDIQDLAVLLDSLHHYDTFIIDAIFGIGINKPLNDGLFVDAIRLINESPHPVAAIDIPSGLSDEFLPDEGAHINADVTATFQNLKWAHFIPDGNTFCGKIEIIDIGIPVSLQQNPAYFIDMTEASDCREFVKLRDIDAHKGNFGHCLTICGSRDKPGAGVLSSISTLKAGAGLCTVAVEKENRTIPVLAHPELMTLPYEHPGEIISRLEEFDCILMGPGLGNTPETFSLVSDIIERTRVPLILDADAINVLEGKTEYLGKANGIPIILTPHPREFSRLSGISTRQILKDRIHAARNFSMEHSVYLVLKGHHTIVASPDGRVNVNQTGNPGMATAGSGDVLGGVLAGFVAQFAGSFEIGKIVSAAVFIHGYAGDIAMESIGETALTATDIIGFLSEATRKLNDSKTRFNRT